MEDNARGRICEHEPGGMVVDLPLLLHGRLFWRRPLRAHRGYPNMECVAAIVVCDHSTGSGVPLQRFWIPVHTAITVFILLALFSTWNDITVRRLLLISLASYVVMRVWSGVFFIREMLAFQKIPLDSAQSAELSARVARWTYWTWFREPLDIFSFLCSLLAAEVLVQNVLTSALQGR
jgi:hypothetical protein